MLSKRGQPSSNSPYNLTRTWLRTRMPREAGRGGAGHAVSPAWPQTRPAPGPSPSPGLPRSSGLPTPGAGEAGPKTSRHDREVVRKGRGAAEGSYLN